MGITGIYQCPACGNALNFQHEQSTFKACSCGKAINRLEGDVLIPKTIALVDHAYEPIQPGTTGKWDGKVFEVLGRCRLWLEESAINLWTIVYTDNSHAYLLEAYGMFTMLEKHRDVVPVNSLQINKPLESMLCQQGRYADYLLHEKNVSTYWELEGEVILPAWKEAIKLYEYASLQGNRMVALELLYDYILFFDAHTTSFEQLQLKDTRPTTSLANKTIECPNCTYQIQVKTWPYAQSVTCKSCNAYITLKSHEGFALHSKHDGKLVTGALKVGSKGKLNGITYEVLGFTVKREKNEDAATWKEYTLYNSDYGFITLSEFDGHWIVVKESASHPVLNFSKQADHFYYGNKLFKLYNDYKFKIVYAEGEFPSNIFNDEQADNREFICPPEMWILEKNKREGIIWYYAQNLNSKELEEGFETNLPWKSGKAVLNPEGAVNTRQLILTTLVLVGIALAVHLGIGMSQSNKVLLDQTYNIPDSSTNINYVTDKFTLTKWKSNLAFEIYAPVDNCWFELGITLVNADNGTEYSLEQGVERYSGYSDGESWSEGGNTEDAYLSSIPAGTYFLQLRPASDAFIKVRDFHVKVTNDVPMSRNLVMTLLLMLSVPLVLLIRNHYTESARWKNSPYSPYNYEE